MKEKDRIKVSDRVKTLVASQALLFVSELEELVEKYQYKNPFTKDTYVYTEKDEYDFLIERYVTREITKAIPKIIASVGKVNNTQEYTRDMPMGHYRINGTKRILWWDGKSWFKDGRPYGINFKIRTVEPL